MTEGSEKLSEPEYRGLMALGWDPLRGDTSDWEDRAFYLELIRERGEPVLDIGCGTGRLLLDYLSLGIDIDGIDISPDMLAILRQKAAAAGLDITGRIHHSAMQDLTVRRCYQTIIVPSGSFQLVLDPHQAATAMQRFFAHLRPGGTLAMPWINIPLDHPDGGEDRFEAEAVLTDGSTIRRRYRAWYDPATLLEHTDDYYEVVRDGVVTATDHRVRSPATRHYPLAAIASMLRTAGFVDVEYFAGMAREPLGHDDRVVVTVATRSA